MAQKQQILEFESTLVKYNIPYLVKKHPETEEKKVKEFIFMFVVCFNNLINLRYHLEKNDHRQVLLLVYRNLIEKLKKF